MRGMSKVLLATAIAGLSISTFATNPARADVYKAQLGIKVEKGLKCPRAATMTMWAHSTSTDSYGGGVFFRVHNNSGIKSGWYSTTLKKGPSGNYLATYNHTLNITANTDVLYRIEAKANYIAGHVWSNWVPLKALCKPKKAIGTPGKGLTIN